MIVDSSDSPRATIDSIEVDDHIAIEKTIGESDVYLFAGICGDLAPNHINERYMQATQYKTRIAQGALIVGFTSAAAAMFGARHRIDGVSAGYDRLRFLKAVFIGDTIRVDYRIARIDRERRQLHADLKVTNQRGELVLVGEHLLRFIEMASAPS